MFEIFTLCGKQYEFIPNGLEIAIGIIVISFFISLGSLKGKARYLLFSFVLLSGAGYIIYKDKTLKSLMLVDALKNPRCIDTIIENYEVFKNHYEDKLQLVTKIEPDSLLKYDGKNKIVLMDMYRRYLYGVNGMPKDDSKAIKIKEKMGY